MKLMGHRGARDKAPENTIRSFQSAIDSGVPAIEFDIHQSTDGVWVVHHDDALERTTVATGKVAEKSWAELSQVRTKEGDPLPRLEQVLELGRVSRTEMQIEIKSPGDFGTLGALLQKNAPLDLLTVISFNHLWLRELKEHHPQIRTTCLLFGRPVNPVEIVRAARAEGLSVSVNWMDEALVRECHAADLKVTAWNANDHGTFLKMKKWQVDYLGTDMPWTAREW